MRVAAVVGLLSSVTGAFAIMNDSIPWWYVTMVINGLYNSLGNSVCYALFADSIPSEERTKATTTMAIINNVAQAAGPGLSLIAFMYIGDNWELSQLRLILGVGMLVFNPLACLTMLFFKPAPFQDAGGDGEDGDTDGGKFTKIKGAGWVPFLVAFSDLITMIGAGMTIKYFNLYWKEDWHLAPSSVLMIAAVQPLSVAFFIRILENPARLLGRAHAALLCSTFGILAMIVLAETNVLWIALFAYF